MSSNEETEMQSTHSKIAQRFVIPERQSKIRQMSNPSSLQLYCICQTADCSRFMIGCDQCDEWYHGDCIGIDSKEAKMIKRFFCTRCRDKFPTLRIKYKRKYRELMQSRRCEKCEACRQKDSCGKCTFCIDGHGNCVLKHCLRYSNYAAHEYYAGGSSRSFKIKSTTSPIKLNRPAKKPRIEKRSKPSVEFKLKISDDESDHLPDDENLPVINHSSSRRSNTASNKPVVQCYGPGCIKSARPDSDYCCEECGVELAVKRLLRHLPRAVEAWNRTPSRADDLDSKALARIKSDIQASLLKLKDLDEQRRQLESLILTAKSTAIDNAPSQKVKNSSDDDSEAPSMDASSVHCVVCGHSVSTASCVKHMERCFAKTESQTSYGSVFQTKIPGLFCDTFSSREKTFCKRLKVLCPEHTKDYKANDKEVCGCPLTTDLFKRSGAFCSKAKKRCVDHHKWEIIRRALIDMERVNQLMRLESLYEQERNVLNSRKSRGNCMAILLNSTYEH